MRPDVLLDVIYKYRVLPGKTLVVAWPGSAQVLRAECEHGGGAVVFWVRIPQPEHGEKAWNTAFDIVGTGHPFPSNWDIVATAPDLGYSNLVWHLAQHSPERVGG